jgi:hypothetical protein
MTILSLALITMIIFILFIWMTPHISFTHTIYAKKNKSAN